MPPPANRRAMWSSTVVVGVCIGSFVACSPAHRRAANGAPQVAFAPDRAAASAPAAKPHRTRPTSATAFDLMPLRFEPNVGQLPSGVDAMARGRGYTLALDDATATLAVSGGAPNEPRVVRMTALGANTRPAHRFLDSRAGVTNYLRAEDSAGWHTNVSGYARVAYTDVYPGIDLVFYGNDGRDLEYDFVVAPGADPSRIFLRFDGADSVRVGDGGELVLTVGAGEIRHKRPLIFQPAADGGRSLIAGRYRVDGDVVRFEIDWFDPQLPLTIDPVLIFSTYFGGNDSDWLEDMASDAAGNVYLFGYTFSDSLTAASPGVLSTRGDRDLLLAKFNQTGSLVYATYLGSPFYDTATGIAVDADGEAYVLGLAGGIGFPDAPGYQSGCPCSTFVAKINTSGDGLVYRANIESLSRFWPYAIAVTASGRAVVVGYAKDGLPVRNAAQPAPASTNETDAYVFQLNETGNDLLFATYLGGTDSDVPWTVATANDGSVYVGGYTRSLDFPQTSTVAPQVRGEYDAFVTKYTASGALTYSIVLGGTREDLVIDVAVDSSGAAVVTGETTSPNFPTVNAIQAARSGPRDAFVTRISPSGNSLIFSTYLGGSGFDDGLALAADAVGNTYVGGHTTSADFPVRLPTQPFNAADGFFAMLDPEGRLRHATFLGGNSHDEVSGIALGPSGSVYAAGTTLSTNFPIAQAFQPTHVEKTSGFEFFVTRLAVNLDLTAVYPGVVPPATSGRVTLAGFNFFGDMRVLVGGQWATEILVNSTTSMTVTMPALPAGVYDIAIIDPDGQSATLPNALLYGTCRYNVPQTAYTFGPQASQRSIALSATPSVCTWLASSDVEWLSVATAIGRGAEHARVNIGANNTGRIRIGTLTVAGQRVTITQGPAAPVDLSSDGREDVIWQNEQNGRIAAWFMNGETYLGAVDFSPAQVADTNWKIVGTGDLNGDGHFDLIWHNSADGRVAAWLMNGTVMTDNGFLGLGQVPDIGWRIRTTGDFNDDGKADLVWQHDDGRLAMWFMNGYQLMDGRLLSPAIAGDIDWQIAGSADFDRDGARDLLFRHRFSGAFALWRMDGATRIEGRPLPWMAPPEWELRAIGDLDGNGSADLVWQLRSIHGTNVQSVWLMDGLTVLSGPPLGPFPSVDPAWRIVAPR